MVLLASWHQEKNVLCGLVDHEKDGFFSSFLHFCGERKWGGADNKRDGITLEEYRAQNHTDLVRRSKRTRRRSQRAVESGNQTIARALRAEMDEADIQDENDNDEEEGEEQLPAWQRTGGGDGDIDEEEKDSEDEEGGGCDGGGGGGGGGVENLMPTGEPRAKGRKQNYTRRKLEFEMLWYVWSTKTKQEVFKLLDSRRSCSDYARSRSKREKRNGVMDVDPRIDWAWAKFPKFRTLWNALEVDLRVAVEGTTKCIDGDIRPLLLLLPVQLIKLVYLYKYKIARCTSTFMHRVRYWFKEFGEGQSLLKFIAANCRNLMNDALIEYVNSMK